MTRSFSLNRVSLALFSLGAAGFAIGLFVASCTSGPLCSAGLSRCGLGCADFNSDSRNCGACNVSCQTHQVCQSGQCQCQAGTVLCGGACVIPSSDPDNCGGCAGTDGGVACTATQVCETGQCKAQCTLPGLTPCARACVNRLTDRNNCGTCGNVCDNARSCHSGTCVYDIVAACGNTGQVVGIQGGTDLIGPLSPIGSRPQALGVDQNVLLVADVDRRLRQARVSDLSALPGEYDLVFASPNHILVDDPYIYIVNSFSPGNRLQVLQRGPLDAGTGQDAGLQLTRVGEPLNFGPDTSPQAIAKIGNDLYIPLYGGFDGTGAGVAHVDVSNPASPVLRETISLSGIDLRSFDGGTTYPRPAGVALHRGLLYVTLSNLNPAYSPGGPGIVARVDRDAGTATPIYLGDVCLNTFWVQSMGSTLLVSCSGKIGYDRPPPFPVDRSAVLALDPQDRLVSSWTASCGSATSCAPPSAGRFSIFGDRLYVGDNASGRVFVLQLVDNQLIERRGYADGGQPPTPCPPDSVTGLSYVPDIVSVP